MEKSDDIDRKKLKEIRYMLNNYKKNDSLIDKRKDKLFSRIRIRKNAWLQSKTQLKGSTIEDIVSDMDDDSTLQRLYSWKEVLKEFSLSMYENEDYLLSSFFKLKYLDKKDDKEIAKTLELEKKEIDYIENKIIEKLYEIKKYYENGYYLAVEVAGATETSQHWVAVDNVKNNTIVMLDPGSYAIDMWQQYDWNLTTQFVYFKAKTS